MSTLRESLQEYLAMRRALGFKLRTEGTSLSSFVSFMEQARVDYISTDLALAWAKLPTSVNPARWARRLSYVRGFARYCSAIDSRTEIPPTGLLPLQYQRPTPYFFSDNDIQRLLQASLQLPVKESFVSQTFYCLFGLLSVSGLRISEVLGLAMDDVDLVEGILTIRSSKFGKSRLIPLHTTAVEALVEYRQHREKHLFGRQSPYWFVNLQGDRLGYDSVRRMFHRLLKKIELLDETGGRKPHLHDFRHYVALSTLLKWYSDDQDVEQRLPILSAYLGHVQISDTYWYLSAHPQLLNAAKERLARHWEKTS